MNFDADFPTRAGEPMSNDLNQKMMFALLWNATVLQYHHSSIAGIAENDKT